jgi:2-methylcitrate dehydratase PrpD
VDDTLPRGVSCLMTMVMEDGSQYVSQVDYPKGSIQNSMNDIELRAKFDSLVTPVLGAARAVEIADMIQSIESCANVCELMKLTAK